MAITNSIASTKTWSKLEAQCFLWVSFVRLTALSDHACSAFPLNSWKHPYVVTRFEDTASKWGLAQKQTFSPLYLAILAGYFLFSFVQQACTLQTYQPLYTSAQDYGRFAAKELQKLKMSYWKGCFKLAVLVRHRLKWNRNSKAKKGLEGAEKDESTHPTPGTRARAGGARGSLGCWWQGMMFSQTKEKPPEPEQCGSARELQKKTADERLLDRWNCPKWGRREKAVICKNFNCEVI